MGKKKSGLLAEQAMALAAECSQAACGSICGDQPRPPHPGPINAASHRPYGEADFQAERASQVEGTRARAAHQITSELAFTEGLIESAIARLSEMNYSWMQIQGFWEGSADNFASKIALVHSELSEALEADRKGIEHDDKIRSYAGVEAELADTLIRIFDIAGRYDLDLGGAVLNKMRYNLNRAFKHGKGY